MTNSIVGQIDKVWAWLGQNWKFFINDIFPAQSHFFPDTLYFVQSILFKYNIDEKIDLTEFLSKTMYSVWHLVVQIFCEIDL